MTWLCDILQVALINQPKLGIPQKRFHKRTQRLTVSVSLVLWTTDSPYWRYSCWHKNSCTPKSFARCRKFCLIKKVKRKTDAFLYDLSQGRIISFQDYLCAVLLISRSSSYLILIELLLTLFKLIALLQFAQLTTFKHDILLLSL